MPFAAPQMTHVSSPNSPSPPPSLWEMQNLSSRPCKRVSIVLGARALLNHRRPFKLHSHFDQQMIYCAGLCVIVTVARPQSFAIQLRWELITEIFPSALVGRLHQTRLSAFCFSCLSRVKKILFGLPLVREMH